MTKGSTTQVTRGYRSCISHVAFRTTPRALRKRSIWMRSLLSPYVRLPQSFCLHPKRLHNTQYLKLNFCCYSNKGLNTEGEAMGKDKAQISLKTPKGTQDCTYHWRSRLQKMPSLTICRGGKGYGYPGPHILDDSHCLQAPRRSDDRHVRHLDQIKIPG